MCIKYLLVHIYVPLTLFLIGCLRQLIQTHPFCSGTSKSLHVSVSPKIPRKASTMPQFFKIICPSQDKQRWLRGTSSPPTTLWVLRIYQSTGLFPEIQAPFLFLFQIQSPICHLLATTHLDFPSPAKPCGKFQTQVVYLFTYINWNCPSGQLSGSWPALF